MITLDSDIQNSMFLFSLMLFNGQEILELVDDKQQKPMDEQFSWEHLDIQRLPCSMWERSSSFLKGQLTDMANKYVRNEIFFLKKIIWISTLQMMR